MNVVAKILFILFVLINNTSSATIYGNGVASGKHFCKTTDGGYMLCGKDGQLVYIVKTDSMGHFQWSKYFGFNGTANSINQTNDSGYIMMYTWDDPLYGSTAGLMKLNSTGDSIWSKKYQTADWGEYGVYAYQLSVENYKIATISDNQFIYNPFELSKTDSSGNIISGSILHLYQYAVFASSFFHATDNKLAVVINFLPYNLISEFGFCVEIIDSTGSWITKSIYDTTSPGTYRYMGNGVCESPDSGFLVVGSMDYYSGPGDDDFYYVKFNKFCDTVWSRNFGAIDDDRLMAVRAVPSGGYIMVGNSKNLGQNQDDIVLIRIDDIGDTLWTKTFGGPAIERINFLELTNNNGFVMIGDSNTYNMWLVITDSLGNVITDTSTSWISNISTASINIFPNPASCHFYINGLAANGRVEVYNSLSELIKVVELNNLFFQKNEIEIAEPAGVYFLKIYSGGDVLIKKIVVE